MMRSFAGDHFASHDADSIMPGGARGRQGKGRAARGPRSAIAIPSERHGPVKSYWIASITSEGTALPVGMSAATQAIDLLQ